MHKIKQGKLLKMMIEDDGYYYGQINDSGKNGYGVFFGNNRVVY